MQRFEQSRELLGTVVRVVFYADFDESIASSLFSKVFAQCKRIETKYSRFLEGNYLDEMNSRCGEKLLIDEESYNLLELGKDLELLTNGAFSLFLKSQMENIGYRGVKEASKGADKGMQEGKKDSSQAFREAVLTSPVDFGAVGKGYAIDQMVKVLNSELDDYLIDAGGDIFAAGSDLAVGQNSWKIAFEHPLDQSKALGVVGVDSFALASSSGAKRKWGDKHHLLDARTGECAKDCLAVYVQADTALLADAYATALFVMGYCDAKALLKKMPVEAMIIDSTGAVCLSDNFKGELFL